MVPSVGQQGVKPCCTPGAGSTRPRTAHSGPNSGSDRGRASAVVRSATRDNASTIRGASTATAVKPVTTYREALPPPPVTVPTATIATAALAATSTGGPTRRHLAPLLAAALAAAGAEAYLVLSAQPQLPPLGATLGPAAATLLGGGALCLAVAKALLGDLFHVELHRGRLYILAGVPSSGTALAPDSLAVRPTGDVRGNGAYAVRPIPAGTWLGDYSGDLLDREAFFRRFPDGVGDYATAVDDEWTIDAAMHVDDTSRCHPVHMNHSAKRWNVRRYYARAQKRIAYFTSRDIQPGEELLYDYGRAYWRGREHLELP